MAKFDQQDYIRKVEAALKLAEKAGTQEEAEAAYAHAQRLMTKWQIDEAMLGKKKGRDAGDEIERRHITLKRSGLFPVMVQMYAAVAEANNVKLLVYSPSKFKEYAGIDLIGFPSDIDKVVMLYHSLWLQCSREGNRQTPDYIKAAKGTTLGRWRHSFKLAYAIRIGERLLEAQRQTITEVDAGEPGSALALYDRAALVQDFFDSLAKGTARRSRTKIDAGAYGAGRLAAESADIGGPRSIR